LTGQEIPRTPDYAPSRTFYLFTVSLDQVARMVLERCYQAINNLIVRRLTETNNNKYSKTISLVNNLTPPDRRLLDKYLQYQAQGEPDDEDVDELLTPEEKKKAEAVRASIDK